MNLGKFNDTEIGSTYNYSLLVTEMTERVSKTDKPFVNFVFSDGVDKIQANFFDKTEEAIKALGVDVGKVVDLTFNVKLYNNKKNFTVENVIVCPDPAAKVESFVQSPPFEIGYMYKSIINTIKKVSGDFDTLKYNTGIAALMSLLNDFTKKGSINKAELSLFLVLLNPVAPHITEEMWELIGNEGRVYRQTWPSWDEEKTVEDTVEIMVQVNGKNRKTISVARDIDKDSAIAAGREAVAEWVDGHDTVKEIFVPGRLVNIVVK